MSPRSFSVQSATPGDATCADEGVRYLRRLKDDLAPPTPAEPTAPKSQPDSASAEEHAKWIERRQSQRIRCSGSVEFIRKLENTRSWGTLTDISLHGCYVEMNDVAEKGAQLELVLKSFGMRIEATGEVRASCPHLGMGIGFHDLEPQQAQNLRQLIAMLAGQSAGQGAGQGVGQRMVPSPGPSGGQTGLASVASSAVGARPVLNDARRVLDALAEFFRSNRSLSREQFESISRG